MYWFFGITHTHTFYLPLLAEFKLVLVAVIAKNLSGRQQPSAPDFLIGGDMEIWEATRRSL